MSDVKFEITADNTGFLKALEQSKAALTSAAAEMKETVEGLSKAFEAVTVAVAAVAAVLAGGEAFKEAVAGTVAAATGAQQLARELGITATQASILKLAMDANFVPMEAVSGAANKIAAAIKKNPAEFDRLGVAIRDSSGEMRNSFDIMQDVNTKLSEMQEGTARNVEGQRIYGKAWESIAPSIRITAAAMAEAREKGESLGLIIGKEGVAQSNEYRKAMAGVHEVFEGLEKSIGDAVLPVLTRLAQWFESIGPGAVQIIRGSIVSLVAVFESLATAVKLNWQIVAGAVEAMVNIALLASTTIDRAMHLDFTGAKDAWNQGVDNILDGVSQRVNKIKEIWKGAGSVADSVAEHLAATAHDTSTDEPSGKNTIGDDNAGKSRVGEWQTELEEKKVAFQEAAAAEGQLLEFSKQQEVEYWQARLAQVRKGSEEEKQVRAKIAGEELAIDKGRLEGSLASLKNEEAAAGQNAQARLEADEKYAAAVARVYGEESKQYAEAQRAVLAAKQETVRQEEELDAIHASTARQLTEAQIANEVEAARARYDAGAITIQQLIALEKEYQEEKLALDLVALEREKAATSEVNDPVKYAQILQQIQLLETQHNSQMLKLDEKLAQQQGALWRTLSNTIQQNMSQAFVGVIERTETVHQAFRKMLTGILGSVIETVAKMISKWVEQAAVALLLNRQQALSHAGVAASGAMASAAAIPYVGWILAPIEGAAVYAAALGYSAAGGFDIPAGINPVTQLHQKEMVLPAPIAEPLRQSLEAGGRGLGRGGDVHVHAKMNDTRGLTRSLKKGGVLHKTIKELTRRGFR